jgi:hypothetical protein
MFKRMIFYFSKRSERIQTRVKANKKVQRFSISATEAADREKTNRVSDILIDPKRETVLALHYKAE